MEPRKIAIFVEGQTEQIFVEKLCQEIAGHKNITIDTYKICGKKANRRIESLKSSLEPTSPFFVLLYDCGNDSSVVSDIKKQHKSLTEKGHEKIIGVRDLLPVLLEKKEELEKGIQGDLKKNCNQTGVKISVILAVMEIEAWFLAEWHYLAKIDGRLSPEFIKQQCGIDLENDIENILHPSKELNNIYQLVGKYYDKKKSTAKEIINFLDYEFLYLHLVHRVSQLKKLIDEIDAFLS